MISMSEKENQKCCRAGKNKPISTLHTISLRAVQSGDNNNNKKSTVESQPGVNAKSACHVPIPLIIGAQVAVIGPGNHADAELLDDVPGDRLSQLVGDEQQLERAMGDVEEIRGGELGDPIIDHRCEDVPVERCEGAGGDGAWGEDRERIAMSKDHVGIGEEQCAWSQGVFGLRVEERWTRSIEIGVQQCRCCEDGKPDPKTQQNSYANHDNDNNINQRKKEKENSPFLGLRTGGFWSRKQRVLSPRSTRIFHAL